MKRILFIPLMTILVFALFYCSDENNSPIEPLLQNSYADAEKVNSTSAVFNHPNIVELREKYQVVIQDIDGWELMLNLRKRKYVSNSGGLDSLYGYWGHLVYHSNNYGTIIGFASAHFDTRTNMVTLCGKDSIFNHGNLIYQLKISDELKTSNHQYEGGYEYNLLGSCWYHNRPYQMYSIKARLIKGRFKGYNAFPLP